MDALTLTSFNSYVKNCANYGAVINVGGNNYTDIGGIVGEASLYYKKHSLEASFFLLAFLMDHP